MNELRHQLDKVSCAISYDGLFGREGRSVVLVTHKRGGIFGAIRRSQSFGQGLIDVGDLAQWSQPTSAGLLGFHYILHRTEATTCSTALHGRRLEVIDWHGNVLLGIEQGRCGSDLLRICLDQRLIFAFQSIGIDKSARTIMCDGAADLLVCVIFTIAHIAATTMHVHGRTVFRKEESRYEESFAASTTRSMDASGSPKQMLLATVSSNR